MTIYLEESIRISFILDRILHSMVKWSIISPPVALRHLHAGVRFGETFGLCFTEMFARKSIQGN